jgi:hypothetical protein
MRDSRPEDEWVLPVREHELRACTGKLLHEIATSIKDASDPLLTIAAATPERSSGVGQIKPAVLQMTQTMRQDVFSYEKLAFAHGKDSYASAFARH